jgi:hypothetical protein
MTSLKFFACSSIKIARSSRENVTWFHFWVGSIVCGTHRRWNFFRPRSSRRILKHVVFATLNCRTMSLDDENERSSSIAEIPVATSLSQGLLDLGSFGSLILPTRKRADHLYTVERVSVSLWYTDSSFEWICWTPNPFEPEETNDRPLLHCNLRRTNVRFDFAMAGTRWICHETENWTYWMEELPQRHSTLISWSRKKN